jgi:hypothetical protein
MSENLNNLLLTMSGAAEAMLPLVAAAFPEFDGCEWEATVDTRNGPDLVLVFSKDGIQPITLRGNLENGFTAARGDKTNGSHAKATDALFTLWRKTAFTGDAHGK